MAAIALVRAMYALLAKGLDMESRGRDLEPMLRTITRILNG